MLDNHLEKTHKAYHQRPLQKNLRLIWTIFIFLVVLVWTKVYLDKNLSSKICLIETNEDGTHTMITHDAGRNYRNKDNVVDVSGQFQYLTVSYLIQSLMSFACGFYQVCAIFLFKSLLKYRLYVSRVNKLVIIFLLYTLAWTHVYRLSEPGKICSGDYLSYGEKHDLDIRKLYLINKGNIFFGYMLGVWVLIGGAILGSIVMGFLLYKAFS